MDEYEVVCPQCGEVQSGDAEICASCGASTTGEDTGASHVRDATYVHEAQPMPNKAGFLDRVPWWVILLVVAGYAISPIDFIPDFVPIVGYLDDVAMLIAAAMTIRSQLARAK